MGGQIPDRADLAVRALAPLGMHPASVQGPSIEIARRLALGEHPHDVVPELRPVDARAYCRLTGWGAPTPLDWLAQRLPDGASPPPSAESAYWVLDRLRSSRTRDAMTRALPRVDELTAHICRAAGRSVRRALELADDDAAVMASWGGPDVLVPEQRRLSLDSLGGRVVEVVTARGLIRLGRDQRHCVGAYCSQVHDGSTRILAILDEHGEVAATAALDRRGQVTQCYGAANGTAPQWAWVLARRAGELVS